MTDRDEQTAPEHLTLRVAEGLGKDAGRAIARLDPRDMSSLGVSAGDIVRITGERATVARAMPAFPDARGRALLQIDGITRTNAGTALDRRVRVERAAAAPAARLVLRPAGRRGPAGLGDVARLRRLLEGMPVVPGDRVRVTLLGTRHQELEVVATVPPAGSVVVHARTELVAEGPAAAAPHKPEGRVAYEDLGGLRKEVRRVREMIELPLRYPQLFEQLGIDPPKGVLLHGPPGTGKTLLARAVAQETEAAFMVVSGPEVIHKFYGESEAKLRGIFEQARKLAPCVLFIDEIDAIAPRRENVQGEVEKRVVAQLLALMDGLEARGQIVVIAATNLPNSLDPALRRPGRFDREIEIGVPDVQSRREILEIHTRGMPLAADVDLAALAAASHGFVGADLAALCREAAMTALRAVIPELDLTRRELPDELLASLRVDMADFRAALAEIEPSALREVCVEVPDVAWDDVGGLDDVKRELREAVELPLRVPDLLRRARVRPPQGILLFGPPGTGKTLLARAVAARSGVNFISIKGPALLSRYVGDSERAVRDVFRKARTAAPCVLFFDEIDALAPRRGAGGDDRVSDRVLGQLLTEMDGVEELRGVLVLAATNRLDILDPALLRPGRFDLRLAVPPPDARARADIFAVHLRGVPLAADVDLGELAARADGLGGAHIEAACRRAGLLAVRRALAVHGEAADAAPLSLDRETLLAALAAQADEAARDARRPPLS